MATTDRILAGLAVGITLLASLPANAGGKPNFRVADRNNDGRVSIDEARRAGVPEAKARDNDLNGDGKLTRSDWRFLDMADDESN